MQIDISSFFLYEIILREPPNGLRLVPERSEWDTCVWASVYSAWEQDKLETTLREMLAVRPREASCKGANEVRRGARFVSPLLTLRDSLFIFCKPTLSTPMPKISTNQLCAITAMNPRIRRFAEYHLCVRLYADKFYLQPKTI